jgi:hypothetical protein
MFSNVPYVSAVVQNFKSDTLTNDSGIAYFKDKNYL